jgi:type III secretion protein V
LDPATTAKLVEKIKGEVGNVGELPTKPVLITSMDIRRYVRKLIEADLYDIPVLSYQELTPEITVHPLGKVAL